MIWTHVKTDGYTDAPIKKSYFEISEKRLGVTAVVENRKVVGIITDGDIRRMLNDRDTFTDLTAKTSWLKPETNTIFGYGGAFILEDNAITQLVVVDNEVYKGVLHLHDILKRE
jgi:arabinose-5-phosphate isomerase